MPRPSRRGLSFPPGTNASSLATSAQRLTETNSGFPTWCRSSFIATLRGELAQANLFKRTVMDSRINHDFDELDHRTCRSICDAVGERLQRDMRPESSLSPDLQQLVDQLRKQETRAR
jgi:hypothetical protein